MKLRSLLFVPGDSERKFVKALTEREITAQAARGRVDMGGRDLGQKVDVDSAIATALEAFERIDGKPLFVEPKPGQAPK